MAKGRTFRPPPWTGEFGWEVMSWAPWCRAQSRAYARTEIVTFGASASLYADFADRVTDHGGAGRSLQYPKDFGMYYSNRPGFEHVRYGRPVTGLDLVCHVRGIGRKAVINWRRWGELAELLVRAGLRFGVVGTPVDGMLPGAVDLRGVPLAGQMNAIAGSRLAVGVTSGTMHLAAACGTDLVVWGDTKTRYRETLEQRYKETWNPHHVGVGWIDADDYDPSVDTVFDAIENLL